MCGFAGFSDFSEGLWEERYLWGRLAAKMGKRLSHRGPDDSGTFVTANTAMAHTRLAVIDPQMGRQPMSKTYQGTSYSIVYNGEIYNFKELRALLLSHGHEFQTDSDTEVLLDCYMEYGENCVNMLNGIFAFAVDDGEKLFLARDRFGVKPLFYSLRDERIVFSSEIKALFEYPGINPVIGRTGLCEVFGLGPARTPGCGVFEGIKELKPGYSAVFSRDGFKEKRYYQMETYVHQDSYEQTAEKLRFLLEDTVKRQIVSDVPLCTFLSGGLDSSIITALAAKELEKSGSQLSTYSFEFEGNDKYFSGNTFQPSRDEPWAQRVSDILHTKHKTLICSNDRLFNNLYDAVIAKDLPGMADVDSSLVYFCREVKKNHVVALCGECADEIFGGYPWFSNPDIHSFPWSDNLDFRLKLLNPEILREIDAETYVGEKFESTMAEAPLLPGENEESSQRRRLSYLNMRWFMQTLLDRKDRCSMSSGLEVRVPYADHRIAEYLYNIPWEMKAPGGRIKGLLRDSAKGLLPAEILERRKSPYPKTYNPGYELILRDKLKAILSDSDQPIHRLLSKKTVRAFLKEEYDYGKPWFGQLMAGPQMLAYLIEINYWLLHYSIELQL